MRHARSLAFLTALTVLPATAAARQACPGQELILSARDGRVLRIDDYATAPTLVQIGSLASTSHQGLAVQPGTGAFFTCASVGFFGAEIYGLDGAFQVQSTVTTDVLVPDAMEFDAAGRLFVTSQLSGAIRTVDLTTGQGTFYSGYFDSAYGVAVHPDGSLYSTHIGDRLARFDPVTSTVTYTVLSGITGGQMVGLEIDCDGTAYALSFEGNLYRVDLGTHAVTQLASFGFLCHELTFTLPADGPRPLGVSYCGPAVPGSSGAPAVIGAVGSDAVADNDVTLVAEALPPHQFGLFITSRDQGTLANVGGGLGTLCLGGSIGRYNASLASSGAAGSLSHVLDLAATPEGTGSVAVVAGETWNYQCWFRDVSGGAASSNMTDAVAVTYR